MNPKLTKHNKCTNSISGNCDEIRIKDDKPWCSRYECYVKEVTYKCEE